MASERPAAEPVSRPEPADPAGSRPGEPAREIRGLAPPRLVWAVAGLWLALLMAVLDASIANVALPAIARDLHADGAAAVWVVNAYQIAIVVSLLPLAALGEILEYRRVFAGGLLLFTLASGACALSRTLPELAAARMLQGFGAAGVMAVNGALVRFTFPPRLLGRGIGLNALMVSLGSVIGPSLASAVLAVAPWPYLFAVNLPLGAPALAIAWFALPESPRAKRRLDWAAAALNVGFFALMIAGVDLATRDGRPALGAGLAALGFVSGALLVRRSLGQPRPLAPVDLMRSPLFALSVLTSVASFAAQMLAYVALPFFFEDALGKSQVATGFLMTPWPLAVGVAAPLAGRLADSLPAAALSGLGLLVMTSGLCLMALAPAHAQSADVAWRMALCGAGFGFFQAPNNKTILTSAPVERSGAAGGMLATARLTGQTVGATLAAIIFHAAASGPRTAVGLAAAFALGGSLLSFTRLRAPGGGRPVGRPKRAAAGA